MASPLISILIGCASLGTVKEASKTGLLAEYRMERVTDQQLSDASGQGNAARVHGAQIIASNLGPALQFRGNDYVDCGQGPSLDLHEALTIECWVRPEAIPTSEVIIAGKGTASYGLNYYRDGNVWWYISDGKNALHTGLALGEWSHVAGTYDGKASRLYLNGREVATRTLDIPILQGGPFLLGKGFQGAINSVRVYDRARTAEEVATVFAAQKANLTAPYQHVTDGKTIRNKECDYVVRVGNRGAVQIDTGHDSYQIGTGFSYPGKACQWQRLDVQETSKPACWKPVLTSTDNVVTVEARGEYYSLQRSVASQGHRVIVNDTLTNVTDADVGVMYRLDLRTNEPFEERLLAGADQAGMRLISENPTVYARVGTTGLGWVGEDDILRLQMEAGSSINAARISVRRFALRPGKSHTFRWVLYPQSSKPSYWNFINQVRRDWDVNTTVQGPFDYLNVTTAHDLLKDEQKLAAYLRRKNLGVIALMPWVDYDNFNAVTKRPASRPELKALLQDARKRIQQIDPTIKCIGCIEGNLVSLPSELQTIIYQTSDNKDQNQYPFTAQQMDLLRQHQLPWQDCLLYDAHGRCRYELYYRGSGTEKIPMVAISVYAALNNGQHKYWLDEARWLLEEVGVDGLYIDQFNMAFDDAQRYSYDKWDGTTVEIDEGTGQIMQRCTDAALVGSEAQRSLADYVNSKNGYMLANTFPATRLMQNAGIHRFNESEWGINLESWKEGDKSPLFQDPSKGQLSTPIALGFRPEYHGAWGAENYAKVIHKGAIAYLRHGLLYYHYNTEIPEMGTGAGDYGAINHMFPITPIEIGPGWVIGKERIVTCVSGSYAWSLERKPQLIVFDLLGKPVDAQPQFKKSGNGWNVSLQLNDWAQIAILE